MLGYELDGLKRLDIPIKRWGTSFRVKVRLQHGRIGYISNVSKPSNRQLIAKYYKIKEARIVKHLSAGYKAPENYTLFQGSTLESHLYENTSQDVLIERIRGVLTSQNKAIKVNVQLGYILIDRITGLERNYWPSGNTTIFDSPIAINSKKDIETKLINQMQSADFTARVSYPSSAYQLKEINAAKVIIYYRNHSLGDSDIRIPDCIKNNKYITNFKQTNNKCVFYCLAYHLEGDRARPDRMTSIVKARFKQYCVFTNIDYSLALFKSFDPIDIMEFDVLEECFQLAINVFQMDKETLEITKIRESDKEFDVVNILDYDGHAMYITDLDNVLNKYPCSICDAIFDNCQTLKSHKRSCQIDAFESFVKNPKRYRPVRNPIDELISNYNMTEIDTKIGQPPLDQYLDHFIVYDFEAMLMEIDEQHGANSSYTSRHVPVSVSICDSLSNEVKCIVSDDPKALLTDMFAYIELKAQAIRDFNYRLKFEPLREAIKSKMTSFEGKDDYKVKKHRKNLEKLDKLLDRVPVLGFNSGRYDINLIKKDLFTVLGTDTIENVIKNPSYMCISTHTLKILDISNYLPAGTSYDSYLKTYLGGCKCEDKIRCVCGLGKGLFCYEYITNFEKLNETQLPPKSAFDSKFRGTSISDTDYERLQFVWSHYEMKSIKDLLIWYNNLDVQPFVKAINEQRKLYKRFKLDIFVDGVSLPGLAEKVMYQTCYNNLEQPVKQIADPFKFPSLRFNGYRQQDLKANRKFALTINHLNYLLRKQQYLCSYCYCRLDTKNVSADRIDNSKGHINGNIVMSCYQCNVARKDMSMKGFRYSKLLQANENKLVFSIDDAEKGIYHKMKDNIAGGPSIIFNRYAKRNETYIRNGSKLCAKVIGYDANALYLWCLGNQMPCGRLTTIEAYDGIVDDIRADKIFGFLECDIETPEHLKDHFSEMTPIFKNTLIDPTQQDLIGKHMFEYNMGKASRASKSKKLIGSYFGKQILIYAPLLKWYLDHGLVITKTYSFIKASAHRPFKNFMNEVSDARRAGDADKSKAMVADMMKLIGNSAFGRSGMDKSKHKEVKYESDLKTMRSIVERTNFRDVEELNGSYEISMAKRKIKLNNPIHLSIAIYQLAKLRMLEFYYDCIDFYFDRSDFQYQEMDTDSAYISFSDEQPFENIIKPELRQHFIDHKYDWFPREFNKEVASYDRRTPGLFKEEWRGDAMVSLSPKNYICYLPDKIAKTPDQEASKEKDKYYKVKISAKGVQQGGNRNSDILNPKGFEDVVSKRITLNATNKGFRIDRQTQSIITYQQHKVGLNYYYDKRQVLEDGITTIPLSI